MSTRTAALAALAAAALATPATAGGYGAYSQDLPESSAYGAGRQADLVPPGDIPPPGFRRPGFFLRDMARYHDRSLYLDSCFVDMGAWGPDGVATMRVNTCYH